MENKPEKKFRAGGVTATVWKNATQDQNGASREFQTVSFEKSYKDKSGAWKVTHSLGATDLPKAIVVLSKAYEYVALRGETAA